MNWRHETWRKLYIREEGSFAALSYSARAAAAMLLKHVDDQGKLYARTGEDVVEAICFRFGADRGERRLVRKGIAELVADNHLVKGEGWVRIRNFHRAQGRPDDFAFDGANVSRPSVDAAATGAPSSIDRVVMETRPGREPDVNETRPSIEECVKDAESFEVTGVVPSVPSVPPEPFLPPEGGAGPTRAPDPWEPQARSTTPGARPRNAQWLLDLFGRVRADVVGGLPWHTPSGKAREKGQDFLDRLAIDDPEAEAEIEPTVRLYFERARESQDPRDRETAWAFGSWLNRFHDLREELRGLRAKAGGKNEDCAFHGGGQNKGRPAPKHVFRQECPECRHVQARASPRRASGPTEIGELVRGMTDGR